MREILFRGKREVDGEWVYGYFEITRVVEEATISTPDRSYIVDQETVGQYTGIKDKNGTRIYEGDILRFEKVGIEKTFQVMYYEKGCKFYAKDINDTRRWGNPFYELDGAFSENILIIGNIYDNPELLNK